MGERAREVKFLNILSLVESPSFNKPHKQTANYVCIVPLTPGERCKALDSEGCERGKGGGVMGAMRRENKAGMLLIFT